MQHGTETVLAILGVLLGIKDVEMPEVVNKGRRNNPILVTLKT